MNGIGVCTRLLPGDPRGVKFMGMNPDHERALKEKHLPKIQTLAAREVAPEEFSIRGMDLCNSARDFYYSRFSKDALQEIAELLPGAPVMQGHNYETLPVGVFFDARVKRREGYADRDAWAVEALYSIPNDDQGNAMRTRIDLGIQREVSIGWKCAGATCSVCGDHIFSCPHVPGDIYRGKGFCDFEFSGITNVLEGSMVYRGGQKDTHTFIPQGADEPLAAVAGAASRLMRAVSGDVAWDQITTLKREAAPDFALMPVRLRALIAQYTRASGWGLMCAEPGERGNTQAVVCARSRFETQQAAARFCREHDFRADRRSIKDGNFVFEQFSKDHAEKGSFEDESIDDGVTARICKRVQREPEKERSARNGAGTLDEYLEQVAGASQ